MEADRPWPAWNDAELQVASDSARTARYRLHQSWYREHRLGVGPGARHGTPGAVVGNTLDPEAVKQDRFLNFISAAAHTAAERRAVDVQKEGGTLEVGRLFHNLLSSTPMCFNLFGAIGDHPRFVEVIRALFDPHASQLDEVICEIKPVDSLGDRTAFDAMIRYTASDGGSRFVGIETKYTDPFSSTRYDKPIYRNLTEESGWFIPGAADVLVEKSTNQLWRGLLLAYCVERDLGMHARYAVVCLSDDPAGRTVDTVREQMTEPERLTLVTLESIVDRAAGFDDEVLTDWAADFRERYLDLQSEDDAATSAARSKRVLGAVPMSAHAASASTTEGQTPAMVEPRDVDAVEAVRHRLTQVRAEFGTSEVAGEKAVERAFGGNPSSYYSRVGRLLSKYKVELGLEDLGKHGSEHRWRRRTATGSLWAPAQAAVEEARPVDQ